MNYSRKVLCLLLLITLLGIHLPAPVRAETGCEFTEKTIDTAPQEIKAVHTTDIDSDGDVDFLVAAFTDNDLLWYENDGSENFTRRLIDGAKSTIFSVYAADFDGDNDIDTVASSAGFNPLHWYRNDGSGSFTKIFLPFQPISVLQVKAVDFDKDGDMDILAPSSVSDEIYWYDNNGSATFTRRTIGTQDGPESADAVDLDDDGDLDVLAQSWADDTVAWYENDGTDTSFTKNVVDNTTDVSQFIHGLDIDGDGDTDILVPVAGSNSSIWYENDGSETFTKRTISSDDGPPQHPVDINSDGDIDIITTPFGVYNNNGTGNFILDPLSGTTILRADTADIDGNGTTDVAIAANDDSIRILLQYCSELSSGSSESSETSFSVVVKIDQTDSIMNNLTVTKDTPYTLSSKLPDYDQVQEAYLRVNGNKYYFTPAEKTAYFVLPVPNLPLGEHAFAFTADWGRTTGTIHGTITIIPRPNYSPFLPFVNSLFRLAYNREITMDEWQYWADRILNMDKSSSSAIFGAMQWQRLFGG